MNKILLFILSITCSFATLYPKAFSQKQNSSDHTIIPADKYRAKASIDAELNTSLPQNKAKKTPPDIKKTATIKQQECNSFKSILPIVQSYNENGGRVLILVDIDGTLLREDNTHAAIDPNNCVIINDLQNMPGITVLGLTARDYDLYEITQNLLENCNINFAKPVKALDLLPEPDCKMGKCQAGYINGVIYAHGSKDTALKIFLDRNLIKISPNGKDSLKIIFIDNEQRYINQVAKALTQLNIDGNLFLFIEPKPVSKPQPKPIVTPQPIPASITVPAQA